MAQRVMWSYGVTTVPGRLKDLLPRTLDSLAAAGFDRPRLFVDGEGRLPDRHEHLEITWRWPALRAYGNWILALAELYIREPTSRYYALFQDDVVAASGLRQYLERCGVPERCYLNLYCSADNYRLSLTDASGRPHASPLRGWFAGNQKGRGALGLVFTGEGVRALLTHPNMVDRPMDAMKGHQNIDGAISTSLIEKSGYTELIHVPSLLQHTGAVSAIGHKVGLRESPCWRGDGWDCLEMLG
jgi:hypothetical protein